MAVRRGLARRVAAAIAPAAALAGVFATAAPAVAAPATPFPGNSRSHYLTSLSTSALRAAGDRDARDARRVGLASALVVLDAGTPAGPDGSVRLPDTHTRARPAQVIDAVVAFGRAWRAAHGPPLVLVAGVAGYGPTLDARQGASWGRVVTTVAGRLPGVDVRGGLDAEMEWNPPQLVRGWVRGYQGATSRGYVDFGSCTCPPRAAPPRGWTLSDRWAVATGDGRGVALPEVYANAGGNAEEWAALVAWSRTHHPSRPVRVVGVLTEAAACLGPPRRPCAGIDASPEVAWQQLASALGSRGDELRFASDIGYLPQPGTVRGPLAPVGGGGGLAGILVGLALVAGALGAWWRRLPAKGARRRRKRSRRSRRHRRTGLP